MREPYRENAMLRKEIMNLATLTMGSVATDRITVLNPCSIIGYDKTITFVVTSGVSICI